LFNRNKKGVELTTVGKMFFNSCQNIFNEIEQIKSQSQALTSEFIGELFLAASDNLCNYVLPDIIQHFSRAFPQISIKLFSGTSDQIKSEILEGKTEFGIFYTDVKDRRAFEVTKLGQVEFVIVYSSHLQLKGNKFRAIQEYGYIGSRQVDYLKKYPALQLLNSIGINPRIVFETNSQETQKRLVIAGLGYTLIPRHMVSGEIKNGTLKTLATSEKLFTNVFFVKKKGRSLSKQASAFEKLLINYYA
jgi:DNA-binding transcriptional LysR family regulator